jgi:hypothetical protein
MVFNAEAQRHREGTERELGTKGRFMQMRGGKIRSLWIAMLILCLVVATPILGGFVFQWSQVNCRHEDVDIHTGRIRRIQYLLFVPIHTSIAESSLSRALQPEDFVGQAEEWCRVNTFSPGVHYSPHYRYHGAISQIHELEMIWETGQFDSPARRNSAKELLEHWQTEGSYFGASRYLQSLFNLASTNSNRHVKTVVDDLELLNTDAVEVR